MTHSIRFTGSKKLYLYIYYKFYSIWIRKVLLQLLYSIYIVHKIFVTVAHANCSYVVYDIDEEPCIKWGMWGLGNNSHPGTPSIPLPLAPRDKWKFAERTLPLSKPYIRFLSAWLLWKKYDFYVIDTPVIKWVIILVILIFWLL